jgi:heavy metal sensor kinase
VKVRFRSLRTRVMVWYGALIALCLVAYSIAVAISYARHIEAEWNRAAHEDIELAARSLTLDERGRPSWPNGFLERAIEEEGGGHWIEVWSDDGSKQLLAAGTFDPRLGVGPAVAPPQSFQSPAGHFRVVSERIRIGPSRFIVRAAVSELPGRREIRSLLRELTLLSVIVLALGGLGGYILVRRFLGPLTRMADHARRITAQHLHERLSAEDAGTELNQLRDAFNETLARLESSFDRLRRFTADASHELRTPLTALRSVGEVSLRQARSSDEYRETVGMMLEEADRLSRLVGDLLTLARADANGPRLIQERVDLSSVAREVGEYLAVLAEERQQVLETQGNGAVIVRGDKLALRQAVMNLVDNAIKYSPEGTHVRIVVGHGDGHAFVEVQDAGPGIAPPHRDRIFERFYRVDSSRRREKGGTGLGLAIVKGTAEDHGGHVELDTEAGSGSTFRIVLPYEDEETP